MIGEYTMKHENLIRFATFGLAAVMTFAPINASAATLLKLGSNGSEVKTVQTTLKELGYYTYPKTTGYYGSITVEAVKQYQEDNGLSADGIIGKRTREILFANTEIAENSVKSEVSLMKVSDKDSEEASVKVSEKASVKVSEKASVKASEAAKTGALDWFKEVQCIFSRGMEAVVTDIDTGKSFQVIRTYGTNHADVEALTKDDSNIIKDIWGGWSWERRAVVVQVGDYTLAGSMTAMPHAGVESAPADKVVGGRSDGYGTGENLDKIKGNGASGVMDIHFKNSRTHSTNVVQKVQQDMVKKAAAYIEKMGY